MLEQIHQSFRNCLVYAHRGASTEAIENTRNAFDKALGYSVDGIETDIQLSRDEIAVLWHDRYLDKIGLHSKHIDDFDYDQLRTMINPKSDDESLMTLQDFLISYHRCCNLLLEIKNRDWEIASRHELKVRKTLDLALSCNSQQQIVISSFNLASLVYAHQYKPGFPLICNLETGHAIADVHILLQKHPFLYGFCLPIESLSHALVDLLRKSGKCIATYTCNSTTEISKALQLNVDILISDLPQKALMLRDQ